MNRRDAPFLILALLLLAAPLCPALLRSGLMPRNFGDLYAYHYPLRHLAASRLQEGRVPLWNPYLFAGMPLAANPQAVLFYPGSLLHYFFPPARAMAWDALLHLCWAWLGAYLLLRKRGLDRLGCWALALAYGLSPFLAARVAQGVPTHLAALAWAPWIWLCALSKSRLLLGLALALQLLSGHPQFSLIHLCGLGGYLLLARPRALWSLLAPACALALLLAAVQALPTLELLRLSVRSYWEGAYALGYSLQPGRLLTLLHPNAFGNPLQPGFPLYPSEFFELLTVYIGLLPLALALYGLPRRPALLALAGAGLFLALGERNPLYPALSRWLGLGFLRVPGRFSFLIVWALWLSAATGWKELLGDGPARRSRLARVAAALVAVDLAFWSWRWLQPQETRPFLSSNQELISLLRRGGGRVATAPELPAPDKSLLHRLPDASGYEAFYPAPIAFYTARSERGAAADGSRTYIRRWDTPEMSRLAVRYYVSPERLPGQFPAFAAAGAWVYENKAAGPWVEGAALAARPSDEHWTLRLARAGPVRISQAHYPGWTLWSAGRRLPVRLEDGLFPAANPRPPGPGPWTLHWRFLPRSFFLGLWLTLAATAAGVLSSLRRLERWTC